MELKDFVAATLTQIIEGVVAATPRAEELGAFINPADTLASHFGRKPHLPAVEVPGQGTKLRYIQEIEFDVAVVVKDTSQTKGGASAGILSVVSLGGGREVGSTHESTSRIKFSVPITLPLHVGVSIAEREKQKKSGQSPAK